MLLHGSRARGDGRADSDVDIAVLADAAIDPMTLLDLQAALEPHLEAPVDLVDLTAADDVLRVQVIEHAQVLFERTSAACDACVRCMRARRQRSGTT